MKGFKDVVRFFSMVILLGLLVPVLYGLMASIVEGRADAYANNRVNVVEPAGLTGVGLESFKDSVENLKLLSRRVYLDSVASIPWINLLWVKTVFNYKFCCEHNLRFGFGFNGGIKLVVGVSHYDLLRKISENNPNPIFNKALLSARQLQATTGGDFLSLFKQAFEKGDSSAKLAWVFAPTPVGQGKISTASTNDEVITFLRRECDETTERTFDVLVARIGRFGAVSPNVTLQAKKGEITMDLPGIDDPLRVHKLVMQKAKIEFRYTYETKELMNAISQANATLRELLAKEKANATLIEAKAGKTVAPADTDSFADIIGNRKTDTVENADNPLFMVLYPNIIQDGQSQKVGEGPMIGRSFGKDTAKVNALMNRPEVKALLPRDLKLLWGAHPVVATSNVFGLYAVRIDPELPQAPVTGELITDAAKSYDRFGSPEVDITMNAAGAALWETMTGNAANGTIINGMPVKKCIAIIMDDEVFSSPRVQQQITGGRSQISGIETIYEAEDLANIIKSGALEVNTRIIEEHVRRVSPRALLIKEAVLSVLLIVILASITIIVYNTIKDFRRVKAVEPLA